YMFDPNIFCNIQRSPPCTPLFPYTTLFRSNIFALKKLGAEVMVCGPPTLLPKYIGQLDVKVELDVHKALQWCDVANVLRIQLERSEEHTSELQSRENLVCRLLLEKKK